jgi:RecG-like helicase
LFSCQRPKSISIQKNSFLPGTWTNCGVDYFKNGKLSTSQSNFACPDISFNKNHSGNVKVGTELLFTFSWDLKNDTLSINHPKIKHNSYLDSGRYTLVYKHKKGIHEIGLLNTKRDTEYLLSN